MKQIRGSVRVKIKEYGHAWFEFLFVSLLVIFNFLPQFSHSYYFTSPHGLRDVENHCTHLQTGRKIPDLRFPHIIGLESMKLQTKKKLFASNPEKRTQKQVQKDMNKME